MTLSMLSRYVRRGTSATVSASLYRKRPKTNYVDASHRHLFTKSPGTWHLASSESVLYQYQHRALATAVDDFQQRQSAYGAFSPSSIPSIPYLRPYDLNLFDTSSPLTISDPIAAAATILYPKLKEDGVPRDPKDLLQIFDAFLRVGKLDRAALALNRLSDISNFSPRERILLHNRYLRATLMQLQSCPNGIQAEKLHKWYEMNIHLKHLPHTAETVACMLKASILSERGSRLTRLIKRYMGMAPGASGLRVLRMDEILSDQDLAIITAQCPTYNFSADIEPGDTGLSDEAISQKQQLAAEDAVDLTLAPLDSNDVPELLPTPQKGDSLSILKDGLKLLANLDQVDSSKLSNEVLHSIQLQLERDAISGAVARWRKAQKTMKKLGITTALNITAKEGSLASYMGSWLSAMEDSIKAEFAEIELAESKTKKTTKDYERCCYGPFILQSDPTRLAAITIISAINSCVLSGVDKGYFMHNLVNSTARLAYEDIQAQKKEKKEKEQKLQKRRKITYDATKVQLTGKTPERLNSIQKESDESLLSESLEDVKFLERFEEVSSQQWSIQTKAQVGSVLIKALLDSAKVKLVVKHPKTGEMVSQYVPAFSHVQQTRKGKKVGLLVLHPSLVDFLKKEPMGDFLAKHLPMIVEPKPWQSFTSGGFLESKTSAIRIQAGCIEQRLYGNAAVKCGDMQQVFKGLDVLGKTAWQVNRDVLGVMTEAWNSGEEVANMPPLDPKLDKPPEPDAAPKTPVHKKWVRDMKLVENKRSALHSQRCFMNLQLEVARAFRNKTIYFPHNVDYRGRAYPMPTYFNHMGADHARASLRFAKGKPLGAAGLRWLKIHLANVYGLDKASFEERVAFATENMDNIIDSATKPLGGGRWWLKAEDPWQCLAACFELKGAMQCDDPTSFVSHLPIQQDGTCNGLQHYAALGGDTWGAKQVNLEPADRPADVYSAVADLVSEAIAKDAAAKHIYGQILVDKISRKVVKQTVMTNVYGVTFSGAKKQVCKQLDSLYPDLGKECGIQHILLAGYVARHIFQALATMFRGAQAIQHWLGETGGRVCRALTSAQLDHIAKEYAESEKKVSGEKKPKRKLSKNEKSTIELLGSQSFDISELVSQFRSTVVWTTPLRMPVAQPYRKSTKKMIRTCLQAFSYDITDGTDPVHRRKQLQGFPPNFIHSLDASHMILSALECHDRGLDFAAVHDSFWTHAADVDSMNSILRDAFIKIHEEDVIGRLAAEFRTRHRGSIYLAHIESTSPVAQRIKELRKKSKLTMVQELLLEHKRNWLRLSGNPWDLEAAKKIVTPAAVYEDMAASETDVDIAEDTRDIGLGEISSEDESADTEEDENDVDDDCVSDDNAGMGLPGSKAQLELLDEDYFETHAILGKPSNPSSKSTTRTAATIAVWLPLTIPKIPKKGDFKVNRLRESKYFFS